MALLQETRKTLHQRREFIARSIMTLNRDGLAKYGSDSQNRLRNYVHELQKIDAALNGSGDADSTVLAESMAENIAYRNAFADWLRRGSDMSRESKQNLAQYRATISTEGTPLQAAYPGSTSGFLVPMDFWRDVVSAAKSVGPFFDDGFVSMHITETGAPLPIPSDNDITNTSAILNEGGQYANSNVTISQNVLGTFKFSTAVLVSNEYHEDSGIPLEAYLAKRFGKRAQLGLLPFLTNGTGTGQPSGVLNGLTASLTAVGANANDGASGANTIGSDDVANLELALDPAYRADASWMMHGNTLASLRKVKNKQGQPVFESLNRQDPVLLSYPVTINNAMDQLQTSVSSPTVTRTPLAFGAFDRFHVRIVHPVLLRLIERFADFQQVMYALHYRTDSVLVNPAPTVPPVVTLQTVY
jgi:HK97 family phage major capsid protein